MSLTGAAASPDRRRPPDVDPRADQSSVVVQDGMDAADRASPLRPVATSPGRPLAAASLAENEAVQVSPSCSGYDVARGSTAADSPPGRAAVCAGAEGGGLRRVLSGLSRDSSSAAVDVDGGEVRSERSAVPTDAADAAARRYPVRNRRPVIHWKPGAC